MRLKSFFKNLKSDFSNKRFKGFEFNSKKLKRIIYFLQLREVNLMEIIS